MFGVLDDDVHLASTALHNLAFDFLEAFAFEDMCRSADFLLD